MRLANPHALLFLLVVPLLFFLSQRRQRPAAISYSSIHALTGLPSSLLTRLRRVLPVLRVLVLILGILALAQPQWRVETTKIRQEGIAIDMVIDVSRSMTALDLQLDGQQRNRLEVVKHAFRSFIQGGGEHGDRAGDLIGMVTFARYADSISPLTLDHDLLLSLLDQVGIVTLPEDNGTAIGEAIALGVERLRQSTARSRVLILLTDGSNNAGFTDPLQAAQIARALGIKIYTIGAGSTGMAAVAMQAQDGQIRLQRMPVTIDERPLREIARLTRGQYFRVTDAAALRAIYTEIDRLEKTTTVAEHYQQYVERFSLFLWLGLVLLVLEVVLVTTCLRTIP
jgi:Ca-activated chloride channel family protein